MRLPTALCVLAAAAVSAAPGAGAEGHRFTAVYRGHGSGQLDGTSASGSATASGRSNLVGPGTLSGAARGTVTLRGEAASITLTARGAKACAAGSDGSTVSFSGTAKVTGGTAGLTGARGTLSFKGMYVRQTGVVTISFTGRVVD